MLHGGVVSRGGAVVVGDAPNGAELTDMTAFKRILTTCPPKQSPSFAKGDRGREAELTLVLHFVCEP